MWLEIPRTIRLVSPETNISQNCSVMTRIVTLIQFTDLIQISLVLLGLSCVCVCVRLRPRAY